MANISVFIADDQRFIIDGFKNGAEHEPDIEFAGSASNEEELLQRLHSGIDVLLLDNLPQEDNAFLDLIRQCVKLFPGIKIIVLSGKENLKLASNSVAVGARGYVSKALGMPDICIGIRKVCNYPKLNIVELPNPEVPDYEAEEVRKLITTREKQVIALMVKGFTSDEIASILEKINNKSIQTSTIEKHRANIRKKLMMYEVSNDASLGYKVGQWNLLDGNELSSSDDE